MRSKKEKKEKNLKFQEGGAKGAWSERTHPVWMCTNIGFITGEEIFRAGNIPGAWFWMSFVSSEAIFTINNTVTDLTVRNTAMICATKPSFGTLEAFTILR